MERLDLAWNFEFGQLGAGISSQVSWMARYLSCEETVLISFAGFGDITREANLVDLSDLDWLGTFPLMVEVVNNWNMVSGP